MDNDLDQKLKNVIQAIESLDSDGQREILKQIQSADQVVDINKAKSSIDALGSTPIGNTGLTPDLLDRINQEGAEGLKIKDESVLRRLGSDKGLMGFYDKALQSRKNDRLLQGGGMVADMIQRMALINKL
tara:strand:- start:16 stop:405 length:390 start_codon:yes stop_codon:yes gene_type:complete